MGTSQNLSHQLNIVACQAKRKKFRNSEPSQCFILNFNYLYICFRVAIMHNARATLQVNVPFMKMMPLELD